MQDPVSTLDRELGARYTGLEIKRVSNLTHKELRNKQLRDPEIRKVVKWKEENHRPCGSEFTACSPEVRNYCNYWNSLQLVHGVLHKKNFINDGVQSSLQVLVPEELRRQVFDSMHNSVLGAHLGARKTTEKILQKHYWFNIRDDVKLWVKQCDICAQNKRPHDKPLAPLGDMRTGAPMDRLAVDILGPLPLSKRGNKFIQVVTDAFSKWVEVKALPTQTAIDCAEHLVDEVFSRYGCPLDLHSDQGRNYEAHLLKEICRLLEIRKTRSSAKHPQGNGQTERFNHTIIQMIRSFIKGEQDEWDLHLSCLVAAYRAAKHETTGFTPNFLFLGREVRLPGELDLGSEAEECNLYEYVDDLQKKMKQAHQLVRERLNKSQKRKEKYYEKHLHHHRYKLGDIVWYKNDQRREGVCPKLQPFYIGPCLVTKAYNLLDYQIQLAKQGRLTVVHHNQLKPYEGTSIPRWITEARKKLKIKN